jgi:S1-C subfamily serine protease
VVYVDASTCADNQPRAGTGFALDKPGQIITAHHVVGGCSTIYVNYQQRVAPSQRHFSATVSRVYASGDLALLEVNAPPNIPVLKLAPPPPDRNRPHAGLGYANAQLAPDNLELTFSADPATRLREFLPLPMQQELSRSGSRIDTDRPVLRFNAWLEPGMSGGPIINYAGDVIGIVAGGLKSGTVPASWGWPAEWIRDLFASQEPRGVAVAVAGTFFTLRDLQEAANAISANREKRCGLLDFSYRGQRSYLQASRGSDDQRRLEIITRAARPDDLEKLKFDVWFHVKSGATALMPAGYEMESVADACVAKSSTGPFQQVLWASPAQPLQVQAVSQVFEANIMGPRVQYAFGWVFDLVLSKLLLDAYGQPVLALGPVPETRSDGLVFTRKGFIHPKSAAGPQGPIAASFETLAARNGSFMGVGTINDEVSKQMVGCAAVQWAAPGCEPVYAHFKEWTHFILATQLSSFPIN